MQNGIPVGLRSSPSFGLSRSGQLTAIIQSLFWDGSQGWWYDDNDITTLFQDSAGTTPVTAVEQFVGLQLDKSKGLVLGPELATGTPVAYTANGTVSVVGGVVTCTCTTNGNYGLSFGAITSSGKRYAVSFTVITNSGPRTLYAWPGISGDALNAGTTTGAKFGYVNNNAGGSTVIGILGGVAGESFSVSNISVRELPGNHRYAPASGNRPIWSKRVNLLTKTEQFDDAAWVKVAATVTQNATTAPDGTATADKLIATVASSAHCITQNGLTVNSEGKFLLYAKSGEYTRVGFRESQTTGNWVVFDLNAGTVLGSSGMTGATISPAGNGWYLCSATQPNTATQGMAIHIVDSGWTSGSPNNRLFSGNGVDGIFIWGADLRPANQATGLLPLYQRVNTSSDYDTNGFPGYLKADGIDDFLQTNSINFTATDKVTLCAGVRKLSDAAAFGCIAETSTDAGANNGAFALYKNNNATSYYYILRGSVFLDAVSTASFTSPITNVLQMTGDISGSTSSTELTSRINGASNALTYTNGPTAGTGNFGNYPAYFFRRGGSSLPFNGYEYGNVAVGKLLTADQLTALETYMNGLTKAY